MKRPSALELALAVSRSPKLAARARALPPPPDIVTLMRIAAGCPETIRAAVADTEQPERVVQGAAIYYLHKTLFFPGASVHRHLGVAEGASRDQMRLHLGWLMRWLHPDRNPDEAAAAVFQKVIRAWQQLGSGAVADTGAAHPVPDADAGAAMRETTVTPAPDASAVVPRAHRVKAPHGRPRPRRVWISEPLQEPPQVRRSPRRPANVFKAAGLAVLITTIPTSAPSDMLLPVPMSHRGAAAIRPATDLSSGAAAPSRPASGEQRE